MAISIDWATKIIFVPQSFLALISGTLYELDIDLFRLALTELLASETGIPFLDTHIHNPPVVVSGILLARVVSIINGYTVTFEDGQYAVNLIGANSNIYDVVNRNQVSVGSQNSAGLIDSERFFNRISEVWQILGLDATQPFVVSGTDASSGVNIVQTISTVGGITTLQRVP